MSDGVTERDRSNKCFDRARACLAAARGKDDQGNVVGEPTEAEHRTLLVEAQIHALEGLMRQVRDVDDDVFKVAGSIESGIADLSIQVAGASDSVDALVTAVGKKR